METRQGIRTKKVPIYSFELSSSEWTSKAKLISEYSETVKNIRAK